MTLSYEEEEFIADVRSELNRYEMTSSQTEEVVNRSGNIWRQAGSMERTVFMIWALPYVCQGLRRSARF